MNPSNGDLTRVVMEHRGLVGYVVNKMLVRRRLPTFMDAEDLTSEGMIGLIQAAQRYDPDRGVAFSTFAVRRIRGAILDAFRRAGFVPRRAWGKVPEPEFVTLEDAYCATGSGDFTAASDLAVDVGRSLGQLDRRLSCVLLAGAMGFADVEIGPHYRISGSRATQLKAKARRRLRESCL